MTTERYEFSWVGKRAARSEAYRPINKTLRPCLEDSVNFDSTQNLYIEGDNLDALKLLQRSYFRRVKLIYIDPPYNTGHDFIYRDNFTMDAEDYEFQAELFDDAGNKNFRENPDTNPRFHSDWCSMIYSRLLIARNLLSDDGVIFISIDDNEQANLRKICDEVFGERNFVANVIWERAYAPVSLKKHFSPNHDYIICYAKDFSRLTCNGLPRNESQNKDYKNPDNDPRGVWKASNPSVGPAVAKNVYEIISPSGRKMLPPKGRSWIYSKEKFQEMLADNRIYFGKDGNSIWAPKIFLSEVKQRVTPMTIWKYTDVGHSQDATKALKEIFDDESVFTYPKPIDLIKRCLELYSAADSIVMDFFSGSATTAHAVMELNAADGGRRKFILVQLPELCAENSEAFKAGYKNICEIGKERIRRAGRKFSGVDTGFRVLKIDSSNFKDIPSLSELTQEKLLDMTENIKPDRNALDLLFGCLIEFGLDLSLPISAEIFGGATIYNVADELTACFDENLSLKIFEHIAEHKPLRVVFRDSCFASDADKFNACEIFKWKAPNARLKVI